MHDDSYMGSRIVKRGVKGDIPYVIRETGPEGGEWDAYIGIFPHHPWFSQEERPFSDWALPAHYDSHDLIGINCERIDATFPWGCEYPELRWVGFTTYAYTVPPSSYNDLDNIESCVKARIQHMLVILRASQPKTYSSDLECDLEERREYA